MHHNLPWLLSCAFLFGAFALVVVGVPLYLYSFFRVARSNSPRGAKWRRLFGASERSRNTNAKTFYWLVEERTISGAAAAEFAASRGYRTDPSDPALLEVLKAFTTVPARWSGKIAHIVGWTEGDLPVWLFMYTHGSGDTLESETMIYIDSRVLGFPPFLISDKTLILKLIFSGRNIAFAEDATFSELFHLQSSDEDRVRELFNREVRAAFVAEGNCQLESSTAGLLFRDPLHTTAAGFAQFTDASIRLLRSIGSGWKQANRFRH